VNELQRILFSSMSRYPAYLDPSSSSILLQLIVAGLLGFSVYIGSSWKKIKRFLSRKKEENQAEEDE